MDTVYSSLKSSSLDYLCCRSCCGNVARYGCWLSTVVGLLITAVLLMLWGVVGMVTQGAGSEQVPTDTERGQSVPRLPGLCLSWCQDLEQDSRVCPGSGHVKLLRHCEKVKRIFKRLIW